MAFEINKHLDCVLYSHKLVHEKALLDKHHTMRDKVKEGLEAFYADKIYAPFNSGSIAKNTAVNVKFDIDLMVPFKRNAFSTLEEMYDAVLKYLTEKYHNKGAKVRPQKVSIGIEFDRDQDGHVVKIDVVPGRELSQGQYPKDKSLNLNIADQFGKISKGSEYIKSNIEAQIEHIRDRATNEKDSIRKVIRLLKIWKFYQQRGPKSFFLELITIKAFDSKDISGSVWEKLKAVLEYIRDNAKTVSLPDPGNKGGNDVAESMSDQEKSDLVQDMKLLLDRIAQNEENIQLYFKINAKHPCEKDEDGKYEQKNDKVSVPPPVRFG